MHHGADADGGQRPYFRAILPLDIRAQIGVAILQSGPDGIDAVSPQSVHELVFPFVAALGYRLVFPVDEDGFDAGGAELNAQNGFAGFDG